MANFQNREDYERGVTFGHYDIPHRFHKESEYRKFDGTGLGLKLRMHPMAAAQIRRLNDRLMQLPGLYEQAPRPDMQRLYYASNMLFLDESEAGMSRAACVKALQAEGVQAHASSYRLQHKCPLYQDAQWWHHLPTIPELPGSEQANKTAIALPYFTSGVPEVVQQYVKAFEKVWAHRKELAAG